MFQFKIQIPYLLKYLSAASSDKWFTLLPILHDSTIVAIFIIFSGVLITKICFCLVILYVLQWVFYVYSIFIPEVGFMQTRKQCTVTKFKTIEDKKKPLVLKELRRLWEKKPFRELPLEKGEYDKSNTLLLDDSPYKALRNPVSFYYFSSIWLLDWVLRLL